MDDSAKGVAKVDDGEEEAISLIWSDCKTNIPVNSISLLQVLNVTLRQKTPKNKFLFRFLLR